MWSAHETRSINSAVAQQRSFSSKSPLEKLLERRVHNRTPHCRTANDSATNPAAPRTELLCAPRPNPRELTRNGTVYLVVFGSFLLIGPRFQITSAMRTVFRIEWDQIPAAFAWGKYHSHELSFSTSSVQRHHDDRNGIGAESTPKYDTLKNGFTHKVRCWLRKTWSRHHTLLPD